MKVFIDGGANIGQSLSGFVKSFKPDVETTKIHCFEPATRNKIFSKLQKKAKSFTEKGYDITTHASALWVHDGEVTFYDSGNEGSTTERKKSNLLHKRDGGVYPGKPRKFEKIKVKCIDLSRFILEQPKEAEIYLKLDIEGGEYEVMPHLDETGALKRVKMLFLELHAPKLLDRTAEADYNVLDICDKHNLVAYKWNGNREFNEEAFYLAEQIPRLWARKKRDPDSGKRL